MRYRTQLGLRLVVDAYSDEHEIMVRGQRIISMTHGKVVRMLVLLADPMTQAKDQREFA